MKMKKIEAAIKGLESANAALTEAVRAELPVGARVSWMHGQHRQYGVVAEHGYFGRMLVENVRTDRRRWIRPSDLVA